MKKIIFLFLISLLLIPQVCFGAAANHFIKASASGGDGTTWATAWNLAEFETDIEGSSEAGDQYFIMADATYTFTQSISTVRDGATTNHIRVIGVKDGTTAEPPTSSDYAYDDDRPLWALGAFVWFSDNYWTLKNIRATSTAGSPFRIDTGDMTNVKIYNSSTNSGRLGIIFITGMAFNCEVISNRGYGFNSGSSARFIANYIHNCGINGFFLTSDIGVTVEDNLVISCATGVDWVGSAFGKMSNNTIYEFTLGVDCSTARQMIFLNNDIDTGTTGISWDTANNTNILDYNNYFNLGTDITNATKGDNATALDSEFAGVTLLSGSSGTYAGTTFDAEEAIDMSSIVVNRDYIWIKSGTGMTAGHSLITSVDDGADQVVCDIDSGENVAGDIVWSIVTGHDFAIGNNLRGQGFPGEFPAGLSTGHLDIGAVQVPSATTIYDSTIYDATIF